jgi:hypothetical protein
VGSRSGGGLCRVGRRRALRALGRGRAPAPGPARARRALGVARPDHPHKTQSHPPVPRQDLLRDPGPRGQRRCATPGC